MEKIEQMRKEIREVCVKFIPEIVESKFGCVVRSGLNKYRLINSGETDGEKWATYLDDDDLIRAAESMVIDEVMGRPVGLADIIYTIDQTWKEDAESQHEAIATLGSLLNVWVLTKDNIDDQPEPAIVLIHQLIVKPENICSSS